MSSSAPEIKCSICDTKFTQKKNLYAHLRNIHGSDSLDVNNFICTVCEKIFKVQKTLDTHIKKYHKNGDKNRETRIICPYDKCNEPLFKFSKLRIQLFEKHNITIEVKELSFSTIAGNTFMNNNKLMISY